jgi:drug/metabolite transporter (DMT)-like permease
VRYSVIEVIVFRSSFALVPCVYLIATRGGILALRTKRLHQHVTRSVLQFVSMICIFTAFGLMPLADATAITFASPLFLTMLSIPLLGEQVGIYRWSAVIVGFVGVLVMLGPHFDLASYAGAAGSMAGLAFAIGGAFCNSGSVIQTRRLTQTETTSSIVFYFSLICALAGLATWPLGWLVPTWPELLALVTVGLCGGLAHILLTESYRLAPASLVAPYDYTSMIWALLLGYVFFGELPSVFVFIGAAIIAGAGLMVLWRERQLGLKRVREAEGPPA